MKCPKCDYNKITKDNFNITIPENSFEVEIKFHCYECGLKTKVTLIEKDFE